MQPLKKQQHDLPSPHKTLASVLREGKDNAITTRDIMMLTGIKDKRYIHTVIEQLINKFGYCIGASRRGDKRGYYLISTEDEYKETLHTYNAQIQSMLKRHRNLQKNYMQNA